MAVNKKVSAYAFSIFLFLGLSVSMIQRVVSEIGLKYSLNNTSVGTIITMVFIGYFISPILTGELTDKAGRKKVLIFTFIVQIAGLLTALLINSPIAVGIGFFIIGMSISTLELSISSLLTDISQSSAVKILNLSRVFFAFGTVSGPFIAMLLLKTTGDWIYVMLAALIMSVLLFAAFIKLSFPQPSYPDKSIDEHIEATLTFKLLKNKIVILLAVSMVAYLAIEAGITFYVARYIQSISSGEMFSTLTLSVFWLCMAIGRVAGTHYKRDPHMLVGALSILAALGLAVCLIFKGLAISIVSFGIMGFGCSAMFPTLLAMGREGFPKCTNTVFGILLSAAGLGGILQPILMGAVADSSGLKAALSVCFAPLLLMLVTQVTLITVTKKKALAKDSA